MIVVHAKYLRGAESHGLDRADLRRSGRAVTVVALHSGVREALVRTGESTDLRVHSANVEQVVSGRRDTRSSVTADKALDGWHARAFRHETGLGGLPHRQTSRVTARVRAVACTRHAAVRLGLQDAAARRGVDSVATVALRSVFGTGVLETKVTARNDTFLVRQRVRGVRVARENSGGSFVVAAQESWRKLRARGTGCGGGDLGVVQADHGRTSAELVLGRTNTLGIADRIRLHL